MGPALPAGADLRARLDGTAVALLLLAVAAVAVSAYLTVVHYAEAPLVCTGGGVIDCTAVTQSSWSTVPGTAIPVAIPGIVWGVGSAVLALGAVRASLRRRQAPAWLSGVHVVWAIGGMIAVFYLVYAEVVPLHRLCEWCTAVHLAVFASLLIALHRLRSAPE